MRISHFAAQNIGSIINDRIANNLQKKALGGDMDALGSLAGRDPRRYSAISSVLQDQKLQKQNQQELLGRIARGFGSATDKRQFLMSAQQMLADNGYQDLAAQVGEDVQQYDINPAQVEGEYSAALSAFGGSGSQPTAFEREFQMLTQAGQMSPEEQKRFARIRAGLDPRAQGSSDITIATTQNLTDKVASSRGDIKQAEKAGELNARSRLEPELTKTLEDIRNKSKTLSDQARESRSSGRAMEVYETGIRGVVEAFGNASTGPVVGLLPAIGKDERVLEAAISIMRPIVKDAVRSAGEGTFTDRDQELIDSLLPTRRDTKETAAKKIELLDNFMRSKLSVAPEQKASAQNADNRQGQLIEVDY